MNKKIFIVTFIMLTAVFALSSPATAIGVGPASFKIEKALKGGEYQKTTKIFNTDPTETIITITRSGEAADWVKLYDESDLSTQVNKLTLPGQSNKLMVLKFKIPDTAANGNYTGILQMSSEPKGGEGMQPVSMTISIKLQIEVIGEEILEGSARSITTRDVEINYPLEIKVEFENKGNVVAKPDINVEIKKGSDMVGKSTYSADAVAPLTWKTIPVELDTSSLLPGNYTADVSVRLGDKLVATQALGFNLFPIGTLTRAGAFDGLSYSGEPAVGKLLKIVSVFSNTGKINTKANFVGEVYRNGELIDNLKSEELLVPVSEKQDLVSYLKVDSPGDYRITGAVLYEGKKTDSQELSFKVQAGQQDVGVTQTTAASAATTATQTDPLMLAGIAALIVLLFALVYLAGKKNKNKEK
jgi:hypothetical protein